jgi:hypothetical protein
MFNLDNNNLLYSLWSSGANQSTPTRPAKLPKSTDVRVTHSNNSAIHLKDQGLSLEPREAQADQSMVLSNYLLGFWDSIANWLTLDRSGILYSTGRSMVATVSKDIDLETGPFVTHMKNLLISDVARVLASSLTQVASESSSASGPRLATPPGKQDIIPQGAGFTTAKARLLSMKAPNSTLDYFFRGMNLTRLSSQPAPTVQKSLTDKLADNIADLMVNGTSANNPLASLIKENKPIITQTIRATFNNFLNDQVSLIRAGFALPGWAAVYQTQWCWGTYDRKGRKLVTECADSTVLEDLNIAPSLQRTLDKMGFHRHIPERVDLPKGIQRALDGVEQFTHGVYAAMVSLCVLTGLTMLVSFANVFMPERFTAASDFFTLGMCVASGGFLVLVASPYAFFQYFNGLVLPGIMSTLNLGYENGWKFVVLLMGAEVLTLIATGWWITLERRGFRDRLLFGTEAITIGKRETGFGMPGFSSPRM